MKDTYAKYPTLPDVATRENAEAELIETSILKAGLRKHFEDYKSSRNGLTTLFFRNINLTKQKIYVADRMISMIDNFTGTRDELITALRNARAEAADLSRNHGKFHYNLLSNRLVKKTYYPAKYEYHHECDETWITRDIRKGELDNKSGLAAVFHKAIDMVEKFRIKDIRNTL